MKQQRSFDICIRLGDKKYIKKELEKIAKKNGITLQQLVIYIMEWFLEEKKKKTFQIKLK